MTNPDLQETKRIIPQDVIDFLNSFPTDDPELVYGLERAATLLKAQQEQLDTFYAIVNESYGVTGWHLNGAIATWEELGLAPPQEQTDD